MIMKIETPYELGELLHGTSYDCFSSFGLEVIMAYLNEVYTVTEYEFEPCAFGSEFTEYSDACGSAMDLNDLINDHGYLLDEDDEDDAEKWERVADAIEAAGRNTVLWIQSPAVNGIVVVE